MQTIPVKIRLNQYGPIVLLGIILLMLYYKVIVVLVQQWWDDPNYSHGFLVPLVSGYFIWQKRKKLKEITKSFDPRGLIVITIGLGIYLIGVAGAELFSVRISLIIVISGLIFYFYGKGIMKELWFPLVFLFFMVPLPYIIYYSITFPLQIFSTKLTYALLNFVGISAIRQGNIIHLQNYSLEVIEACSGLRSAMTLSALGATLAYITQKAIWQKMLLFLSSIPVAIIANVLRLFVTAIIALIFGIKHAEGFLHEVSGIFVFVSALTILGIEGILIAWVGKRKNTG